MSPRRSLAALPGDEVVDALLRLHPLVEVLVAGQDDVDAVLQEQRLELLAQRHVGSVLVARRVERVMEERDLPVGAARRQLLLQPGELGLVHVVAVEREERAALPSGGLNE